jgi:radical SAM protein with 4Fe4S-binding SPASM domain
MDRFEFNSRGERARRMLGIALGRPLVGPQVVSLEVTHHCNLRCSFCESHGNLQALPITARRAYVGDRRTMDLETIQRLASDLARVGTNLVELSGKGDPIAHPQLTQIVRILKDAGLACALVTNGTLAKPDLAPMLIDRRLDRLSVSLNSGSREVYKVANGRDLWDKAIAFLTDVLDRRRSAGTQNGAVRPWVRVTHVISKENVRDIDNMVRSCCDLGVDEVAWYVMGELPETRHLQLDEDDVAEVRAGIPGWRERFQTAGVQNDMDVFGRELPLRTGGITVQQNPLQRRVPCYEGWMFCVIQPDGVVVPCCYCEEEKLGNVFDESFAKIWTDTLYHDFRRRSLAMPKTGRSICSECFTNCNRAEENVRIYNRIHPLQKASPRAPVSEPAPLDV